MRLVENHYHSLNQKPARQSISARQLASVFDENYFLAERDAKTVHGEKHGDLPD
jgi:hypothetical protein